MFRCFLAIALLLLAQSCVTAKVDPNGRGLRDSRSSSEVSQSSLASKMTAAPDGSGLLVGPPPPSTPPEPVEILGEVTNPGRIPYKRGADLAFYLSRVGGTTADASTDRIQIIRGKPGKKEAAEFQLEHPESIPPLQGGDVIIVHSGNSAKPPGAVEKIFTYAASAAAVLGAFAIFLIAA